MSPIPVTVGYLTVTAISCLAVALAIVKLRYARGKGLVIACVIGGLIAILSMIRLRCTIDVYPCGFMSFTGGLTWHIVPGLAAFCITYSLLTIWLNRVQPFGFRYWAERLGRAMVPLLGLSLAAVWEVLPVSVIHPPSHGGPCPDLPVICHDTPLLGRGGLLYWAAPFIAWASATLFTEVRAVARSYQR